MENLKDKLKEAGFMTPPNHVNFLAKRLFAEHAQISDVSIAYLSENGGGPTELHSHPHDHLFIVVSGRVKIILDGEERMLDANESFRVKGAIPHSVWNVAPEGSVMIGITVING